MQIITDLLLDTITTDARKSPRLRSNYNLHISDQSSCHRLFNAIEPGSYIRPHRHLDPEKDETFIMVRGRLGIVTFDDSGAVTGCALISAAGSQVAATISHGVYHTALALDSGSIFFEAKGGPYLPLTEEELGGFAPQENSPECALYLERARALFQ
jgi:cupin fold WbuC family metalloprotein